MSKKSAKAWIEAMRLRTLPVSVSGVLAGLACALAYGPFKVLPFLLCVAFAVMAQIVSNFANEYYDFAKGLDRKGREGFRRGVTEGDISPQAMKRATFILLAIDCLLGCSLIIWGGWWLLAVGAAVALFAVGYSAGPYPLSHHGLGDVAVVIFFGIIPVMFTAYLVSGSWHTWALSLPIGIAMGLLAANVLIVNNYRDMEDDMEAGKRTTVVILGRPVMRLFYFLDFTLALVTIALMSLIFASRLWVIAWAILEVLYIVVWVAMGPKRGAALNPVLKQTVLLMLTTCVCLLTAAATR